MSLPRRLAAGAATCAVAATLAHLGVAQAAPAAASAVVSWAPRDNPHYASDPWFRARASAADPAGDTRTLGAAPGQTLRDSVDLGGIAVAARTRPTAHGTDAAKYVEVYLGVGSRNAWYANRARDVQVWFDYTRAGRTHRTRFEATATWDGDAYAAHSAVFRDGAPLACAGAWTLDAGDPRNILVAQVPVACIGASTFTTGARVAAWTGAHRGSGAADTATAGTVTLAGDDFARVVRTVTGRWRNSQTTELAQRWRGTDTMTFEYLPATETVRVRHVYDHRPPYYKAESHFSFSQSDRDNAKTWEVFIRPVENSLAVWALRADSSGYFGEWDCAHRRARFAVDGDTVTLDVPAACFAGQHAVSVTFGGTPGYPDSRPVLFD